MNKLVAVASLVLSFHAVGCVAQSMEGDEGAESATSAEQTGTQQSALDNGPLDGLHHYKCAGLRCSCTGDVDCNDMFNSGVCGPIAQCDNTTNPPTCWCYKSIRVSLFSKAAGADGTTKVDTAP
jgi:hypothetical protein